MKVHLKKWYFFIWLLTKVKWKKWRNYQNYENPFSIVKKNIIKQLIYALLICNIAQKVKFSIKDFFSKCDQILWIWSHLLKKFLMENFIFCTVKWLNTLRSTLHKHVKLNVSNFFNLQILSKEKNFRSNFKEY